MAEKLDPYRTWLGIPPEEQPPNHYRLLGVGLFESLPDVIANAADRQMAHVRNFQSGKHSKISQKVLNELSAARVCLLDPQKKAAYDEQLRATLAGDVLPPPLAGLPPLPGLPPLDGPALPDPADPFGVSTALGRPAKRRRRGAGRGERKKKSVGGLIVLLVVVGIVVALVFVFLLTNHDVLNGAARPESNPVSRHVAASPAEQDSAGERKPADAPKDASEKPVPSSFAAVRARDGQGEPDAMASNASSAPPPANVGGGRARRAGMFGAASFNQAPAKVGELAVIEGSAGAVTDLAIDKFGSRFFSCAADGVVRQWDVATRREVSTFEGADPPALRIAVVPKPSLLLAACGKSGDGSKGVVRSWKQHQGAVDVSVDVPSLVYDVAVGNDAYRVALACHDGLIRVSRWMNAGARQQFIHLSGHKGPVWAATMSGDHTRILSGGDDRAVRWWDVEAHSELRSFSGHQGPVTCVALSSDERLGASGAADGSLRVWDLTRLKEHRVLTGHAGAVNAVAFTPDGRRLLSAGADGTVRIWRLGSGREMLRLTGHRGPVRALAVAADGALAISGGDDRSIRVWGLPGPNDKPSPPSDAASGASVAAAAKRLAIPPAEAQAPVETTLRTQRFKGEFEAVGLAKKSALARKLFDEARQAQGEPVRQFVLLRLAKDMAATGGDLETLLGVVELLVERFEIDAWKARVAAFEETSAAALPQAVRQAVVEKVLACVRDAVAADRLDAAQGLVALIRPQLPKARDANLVKQFQAMSAELARMAAEEKALQPLREKLRADPHDAAANEALGRALCLSKGRWEEGLLRLARGGDAELRKLAQADLDGPDEPDAQVVLADGWWDLGEKAEGVKQRNLRARACYWYAIAESDAAGETLARAKKRLAESAGKAAPTSAFDAALPPPNAGKAPAPDAAGKPADAVGKAGPVAAPASKK